MTTPVIESGPFAGLPDSSHPAYAREHKNGGGNWTGPSAKGKPTAAHRAKAKALLAGGAEVDPDEIDNPQVRAAYLDQLHEETFGSRPSYREENGRERAARELEEASQSPGLPGSTTPGRAVPGATGGKAAGTRPPSRPAGSSSSPSWASGVAGSDGTGLLFGFLLYALGLNYLRYGPAGITGWLSAKFLNKPNPALTGGALTRSAPTPIVNPDSGYSPGNGSPTGGGRTGF